MVSSKRRSSGSSRRSGRGINSGRSTGRSTGRTITTRKIPPRTTGITRRNSCYNNGRQF